jgi:hypothetical protein
MVVVNFSRIREKGKDEHRSDGKRRSVRNDVSERQQNGRIVADMDCVPEYGLRGLF